MTSVSSSEQAKFGRVLIAGGTDWPSLGRKEGKIDLRPNLMGPHILRSLCNVQVQSVHSSPSGSHFICIDTIGHAHLFGRNSPSALGSPQADPTSPSVFRPRGVGLAFDVEDLPSFESCMPHVAEFVSETRPKMISPDMVGAKKKAKFVKGVVGRGLSILIDSEGDAWVSGEDKLGQCGLSSSSSMIKNFTRIKGPWGSKKIVDGSAGVNFSLLLDEEGKVYSFGSAEFGQLGHGKTGEHIISSGKNGFEVSWEPKLIKALDDKKIVQIASGNSHSLALDSEGFVYVWGYNGYCRLGLGHQKDQLLPVVVPQFAQEKVILRAKSIACGPASSMVIDNQSMLLVAGRWKTTGEGSSGAPYTTFRFMSDMMQCKVTKVCAGSSAFFALSANPEKPAGTDEMITIGWGQAIQHGELAVGEGQPKSMTRPAKNFTLDGIKILDAACSAYTTVFLAEPSDAFSELPRHPLIEGLEDEPCAICRKNDSPGALEPLACDFCERAFHPSCLTPPLTAIPEEPEWFCPDHVTARPSFSARYDHRGMPLALSTTTGGKRKATTAAADNGKPKSGERF
ncbi:Uncharacterized conserved protein, contains RCC1 domain [Phaffia rhodozyma]|uniref:Uncharacterized conserved protein, contains RCC1 domain n=1 Tax=Phaffia rhodozyma TaxID=264483 RepID=A0A0F7SQB7_PHARH|nr:Uncharacterized conserved protein, contains RCC1 domain [Phaffia rhodozyma]